MTAQGSQRALTCFPCSSVPKGHRNAWHSLVKAGQQGGSPAAGVTWQSCSLLAVPRFPCCQGVRSQQSHSQPAQRAIVRGCPKGWAEPGYPFLTPQLNAACPAPSIARNPSLQQPSLLCSPQTCYGVDRSVIHKLGSRWKGLPGSTALGQNPNKLVRGHLYRHTQGTIFRCKRSKEK